MSMPRDEMRSSWDRFARDDPWFFIASDRKHWDENDFFNTGRPVVEQAVEWAGPNLERIRALDFGCGLGRLAVHLAAPFETVDAIDLSEGMVEHARGLNLPENIRFQSFDGERFPFAGRSFDFVFSYHVLQHVPDRALVSRYLKEVGRVLKDTGRAVLQFDSKSRGRLRSAALSLPDPLLPRNHRRFIRRYAIEPALLRRMVSSAGLETLDEHGVGTVEHFLLLKGSAGTRNT
jgi:SAM-dependent methyltransferase